MNAKYQWLVYEQGSHTSISNDWLLWLVVGVVIVVATVAVPGLRRRIWGL